MKKWIYYLWMCVTGLLAASCIDNKVYEAMLLLVQAITDPKPDDLPLD